MRKSLLFSIAAIVLYLALLLWVAPPAKGQPPPPLSQRVAFVATDPTGSCIDWPNPNAAPLEYNYVGNVLWGCSNGAWAVIGQGGGGGGTGTTNILAKFLSATTIGNSSVSDDGVTTAVTENFSLGTNGLMSAYPNSSSGTVAFTLTKLDNSSNAIQILTTDTTSAYGVCVIGCAAAATSTTALIAVAGQVQCMFDNQTVVRDFVVASSSVAGDCHDAGATEPTGVQVIGRVVTLNAGIGTTGIIALFSPDTAQAIPAVKTFTIANANPGTVVNELAKITGAPSAATIAAITDVGGIIGICSGGCGNSGTATILQSGAALCVFDGATTAGDYVQNSGTNAGQCHDAGATYPVPNQVVGRVTSTNGGAGTYGILVFPPESSNPATATIAAGTTNHVAKYTGTNSIGASVGATLDSSSNFATTGTVSTGTGGGTSGSVVLSGSSTGSAKITVAAAAGSPADLVLPSATGGSGQVLATDGGTPQTLTWVTRGSGGGSVTNFSAGTLSPLFTTSVATATTTPALSFSLTNAGAGTVFGNNTSSSGAPAYTAAPVLGVDNTTAGTLQLANSAAAAHTIWGSGATTTNTINGFAVVPTNLHLVDCSVSSTTCTLHDSGLLSANIVLASSPGVGLAHFAGSTQTVTSSAVNLASADVTGILPVANGGTGTNTLAAHGVVIGNTTSAVNVTGAGTSGQVLTSNGASADPTFQAAGGGGLTCTKYTITQSPFGTTWTVTGQSGQSVTSSVTTQTINIVTLASKAVINAMRVKTTTAWAGTSMTNYQVSIGTSASGGSTTSFMPLLIVGGSGNNCTGATVPFAVSTSPFGDCPGYFDEGGSISGADNGETVTATFKSTGGNLTATTAGSTDVTLCTTTLP